MIELTKEYLDELEDVISGKNTDRAVEMISSLHASDIAAIYDRISLDEATFLFLLLDSELAADVLMELDEDDRRKLLKALPSDIIAKHFIDNMASDDAADILGEMEEGRQEEILSHIGDLEQAGDIVDLLHYEDDTAGGMMGKELIAVNQEWSMPTCLEEVRKQSADIKEIYYVYVVDDQNVLQGVLPLKRLITSPSVSKVKHIMQTDVVSVPPDMDNEDVAQIIEKYDLTALPVVDSIGRLLGRITVDDVMDVIREEAEKDYQLASGITDDVESSDSVFKLTKARMPWLMIGLASGMLSASLIGGFSDKIEIHAELAAFIPLIGAVGGNVGIQSSAIVVQSLAANKGIGSALQKVLKELYVSLFNSTILATLIFCVSYLLFHNLPLTYTVTASLFSIVVFSGIFGTAVPLLLDKMKIDPAVATGPFITTANDIIGLIIYMHISSLFF